MKKCVMLLAMIAAATVSADTVNYTYDDAGRLVRVDYSGGASIVYSYDKSGSLLSRVVTTTGGLASAKPCSEARKLRKKR